MFVGGKITGNALRWGGSEEGLESSEDCVDISEDLRDVAVAHGETGGLVAASGSWSDGTKFYVCARGPNHPKEMQGTARTAPKQYDAAQGARHRLGAQRQLARPLCGWLYCPTGRA